MEPTKKNDVKYWRAEILYRSYGVNDVMRHSIPAMDGKTMEIFRTNLFSIGLAILVAPGHWWLVSPAEILKVDIYEVSNP